MRSRRNTLRTCLPCLALLACGAAVGHDEPLREELRRRIESSVEAGEAVAASDRVHAIAAVHEFYERRSFRSAWLAEGRLLPAASDLGVGIVAAAADGQRPDNYHRAAIRSLLPRPAGAVLPARAVDLDLLLTDAFLLLASHRLAGQLDPESIDPEWRATRRGADLVRVLVGALEHRRVGPALDELLPPQEGYARLRTALADHRAIAARGGWGRVPEGPTLRAGDGGPAVEALAERLRASGDLPADAPQESGVFDEPLDRAVRAFQLRHGLDVDGAVGARTRAALNVPADARVRQLVVNLERWRWLPQDLGSRHVLVNIAGFHLDAVADGAVALDMRVIVGRGYRRTPVFSDTMSYLVLNPTWEVPTKIAAQDLLPQFKKDPASVDARGFTLWRGWGADAQRIDPATVDWARVPAGSFPYRLRQKPGPQNALGRVKFMFPNAFNVYLHDTPARELFGRAERTFSSGCIRIERPLELALWLLEGQEDWNRTTLDRALADGGERTVRLARPVRVHLLYWTAWVDDEGRLQLRNDVYGRDARVEASLAEPAPEPGGEPQ